MKTQTATHERINISLPKSTIKMVDKLAQKGGRSKFINAAIRHIISKKGSSNIRDLLQEQGMARHQRDLAIAEEWFALDDTHGKKKK